MNLIFLPLKGRTFFGGVISGFDATTPFAIQAISMKITSHKISLTTQLVNYLQCSFRNAHDCNGLAVPTLHAYILTLVGYGIGSERVRWRTVIGSDAYSFVNLNGFIAYQVVAALADFWVMFDVRGKKALRFSSRRGPLQQDVLAPQRDKRHLAWRTRRQDPTRPPKALFKK